MSDISKENFFVFKNTLKEVFNDLQILKKIKYDDEIKELFKLENEVDLYCEFLFFVKYIKHLSLNIDSNFNENNENKKILNELKIYNDNTQSNKGLYNIILHMNIFLLKRIENKIDILVYDSKMKEEKFQVEMVNQSYQILFQNIMVVSKYYREKIYEIKNVILILDIIIIFIYKNKSKEDKYIKVKNIIFIDLFLKYIEFIANLISREQNHYNIDEILLFLNYIIDTFNDNHLNNDFNFQIISNNKIITNLMPILLDIINLKEISNNYNKYKNAMTKCFANIFRKNIDKSNFFDILIKQNKASFINLVNYEQRKNSIIKDIYLQNFYIELLQQLFSEELIKLKNEVNYFKFNGFNSKMIFKLDKFSLNNTILFFSFQIIDAPQNIQQNFPLLLFKSEKGKDIIFKLYIKKEKNINKLFIYQEKKGKKNKNICLDKLSNIKSNIKYMIAIKYTNTKIKIFMKKISESKQINEEEIDILDIDNNNPILIIGHDDIKNEYYNGLIDSIIIIKNPNLKKHSKIDNIVKNILNLNNLYKFFPIFLSETSFYQYNEKLIFSSIKEENEFNEIKAYLQNIIENLQCELYLSPKIIGLYYSMFVKNKNEDNYFLPEIIDINQEKKYKIINMNISLVKYSSIYFDFLRNNGFDYFILIYEYFYQFFKVMLANKEEFDFYLNNDVLENIFIKTIISTLSIINHNYLYYKHIILNTKKYKTLFRNLHEILIERNQILSGISQEFYELNFFYKRELNELRKYIDNNKDEKQIIEDEKIMSSFSDGLMEIIYDPKLYKNYQLDNNLNLLFRLTNIFLMEYININEPNKIFPFGNDFFFRLLNFINVLEKEFTNDYKNKTNTINNFFELLKTYLEAIDDSCIRINYFKLLLSFVIKNNKNNLTIIINFLNFIYEILSNQFYLENEDIEVLLNFILEKIEERKEENNDNKFIDDINIISCNIIIKLSFIINSTEIIEKFKSKLEILVYSDNIFENIVLELKNNFELYLNSNNIKEKELKPHINYMEHYENIFNFILELLKLIINKNEKLDNFKDSYNCTKIIDLLNNICDILDTELKKKSEKNIHRIYCLINFLIFYYKMIFFESKILLYSDLKFIKNIMKVIEIFNEYYLINCIVIFKFKVSNIEYNKTILEIMFELYIQLFLNHEKSKEFYEILLNKYNIPFFDRRYIDNIVYSIFYVTDNLIYMLTKKKINNFDEQLRYKCENLDYYNNVLFIEKDKFNGNFSTYFLLIISDSQKQLKNIKDFNNEYISKLLGTLNELFSLILDEHYSLYKTDKKYFYKNNSSNNYNEIINYIKNKYIKNKVKIEEVRNFIYSVSDNLSKDKTKSLNIIKEINNDIKNNKEQKINNIKKIEKEEVKIDKTIKFFNDIDIYYVTNIKKEIMNCIFSLYYLDELFYSKDFCIIKKYYKDKFLNDSLNIQSKKLNFPSTIKNYSNNLEPSLFIKKYNNYSTDPLLSITHSYINDDLLKKNLKFEKNIKLKPKDFQYYESNDNIECEIIKNDTPFYGRLYYNKSKNYLLFKQEANNFNNEEGYKYFFLLSYLEVNYNKKGNNKNIILQKKLEKNVLILIDNIEEIIEMRILLLWKGFEIYLKNGKSYVFNFLTTNEYNNFMNNFILNSKIKHLVRKRDFLSDKNDITKSWIKYLISNFEYLLILNRYSSRSFNDLSQYYIFPWLLHDYKYLKSYNQKEKYYLKIKNELLKIKENSKDNIDYLKNIKNKGKQIIVQDEFDAKKKIINKRWIRL